MAQFETAIDAVQRVCGRLGLPTPTSAFTAGQNQTARQMGFLLTEVGRKIRRAHQWQVLQAEWLLQTQPGVVEYALPSGYDGFIDSTAWNTTSNLPMVGPASPQQWNYLKGRIVGPTVGGLIYRIAGNKFLLHDPPQSAQDLLIGYFSRNWVLGGDLVTMADQVTQDSDTILFDPELVVAGLKLAFLNEKGFDTTTAMAGFANQLEQSINRDTDAPSLRLTGARGVPFLNPLFNLPDTGFGH